VSKMKSCSQMPKRRIASYPEDDEDRFSRFNGFALIIVHEKATATTRNSEGGIYELTLTIVIKPSPPSRFEGFLALSLDSDRLPAYKRPI
jgi:hypothetical protein